MRTRPTSIRSAVTASVGYSRTIASLLIDPPRTFEQAVALHLIEQVKKIDRHPPVESVRHGAIMNADVANAESLIGLGQVMAITPFREFRHGIAIRETSLSSDVRGGQGHYRHHRRSSTHGGGARVTD